MHLLSEIEIEFGVNCARCRCLNVHHVTNANKKNENDDTDEEDVDSLN